MLGSRIMSRPVDRVSPEETRASPAPGEMSGDDRAEAKRFYIGLSAITAAVKVSNLPCP